jgi:excisionase family DNA binding protein
MNNELLTIAEFAQIVRVDESTARRWIKAGTLKAVILPHRNERQVYRIKRSVLNGLLGNIATPMSPTSQVL